MVVVAPSLVSEDLATETQSGLGGPRSRVRAMAWPWPRPDRPVPCRLRGVPLFCAGKGVMHAADIHEGGWRDGYRIGYGYVRGRICQR